MDIYDYFKNTKKCTYRSAIEVLTNLYLVSLNWEGNINYLEKRLSVKEMFEKHIKSGINGLHIRGDIEIDGENPVITDLDEISGDQKVDFPINYQNSVLFTDHLIQHLLNMLKNKEFNAPDVFVERLLGSETNESGDTNLQQEKLRKEQIAKIRCQALAKYLWHLNPHMTIEEMKTHSAIQEYGDGQYYKGKNTVRGWLSEVDPRPEDQKTGPKNSNK